MMLLIGFPVLHHSAHFNPSVSLYSHLPPPKVAELLLIICWLMSQKDEIKPAPKIDAQQMMSGMQDFQANLSQIGTG